jgi:hypothetical protein
MFLQFLVGMLLLQNQPSLTVCKVGHRYDPTLKTLNTRQMHHLTSRSGSRRGRISQADAKALEEIARRESTYRVEAKNPKSSAYGLYGFVNKTWKTTGFEKTNCYFCQTEAAHVYIQKRYGSPSRALRFHQKHRYY